MRKERNPYKLLTPRWACWFIRQPSNRAHRLFWGWGYEADSYYKIIWLGVITLWWHEHLGWDWSWNFD